MTDNDFEKRLNKISAKYSKKPKDSEVLLLELFENKGMIDQMSHEFERFKLENFMSINANALWQKWIRR